MESDLVLNVDRLYAKPDPITAASNQKAESSTKNAPNWYDMDVAEWRRMREAGEIPGAAPLKLLPTASSFEVPSREAGRSIPCRLLKPRNADGNEIESKGTILHIHGGGWVAFSEKWQDAYLQEFANRTGLVIVSGGYRLAPENPFPAGPHDCYDVADWLVDNAEKEFSGQLKFIIGESAGAHLALLSHLHLTSSRPSFRVNALILYYGVFNCGEIFPSAKYFGSQLVLPKKDLQMCFDAFLPNTTPSQRADPSISPFYARLDSSNTPPALFICGERDALLDDSIFMAVRWQTANGGPGVLKLYPGAPHSFNMFPTSMYPGAAEAMEESYRWVGRWVSEASC